MLFFLRGVLLDNVEWRSAVQHFPSSSPPARLHVVAVTMPLTVAPDTIYWSQPEDSECHRRHYLQFISTLTQWTVFFKLLSGKEEGDSVKGLLLYTDMRSADQNFIVAPRHSAYKSGSFRCGVSKSLSRRCGLPPCVSLRLFALFRFFRTFPFIYQTSRCICGAFPPTKPFLN